MNREKHLRGFLIILITYIGGYNFSFGQKTDAPRLKITYLYSYVKDTTQTQKISQDTMVLLLANASTCFYSHKTFRVDSLINEDKKKGISDAEIIGNISKYGKLGMPYKIYQNIPTGKTTVISKIVNDFYKYDETWGKIKWDLLNDKTKIFGYIVRKASCKLGGRVFYAWFTEAIPTTLGPWKFAGLPGLILKAEDSKGQFVFQAIGLEKSNLISKIVIPELNYVEVKKAVYLKLEAKYYKHPIEFLKDNLNISVSSSNSTLPVNKPYNPIEFY